MRTVRMIACVVVVMSMVMPAYATQTITAVKTTQAPVIDGNADDACWAAATPVTTREQIALKAVVLTAVYTASSIFFLVTFPDPDESREQKTLMWNAAKGLYEDGPEREDSFTFKWSMEVMPVDLSVYSDTAHTADVWFWKACRTDPVGYADDKRDILSPVELPDARRIISKNGTLFFLSRPGDEGRPAFEAAVHVENEGDRLPKYIYQTPTGSRADVKAKGAWKDGQWTIEFERALDTAHADDVRFVPAAGQRRNETEGNGVALLPEGTYQFGISCFEIAGREPDPETTQPLFGAGDVSEDLRLAFSV